MTISSISPDAAVYQAVGMKNSNIMSAVGTKLLDTNLETASAQGAQLVKMMEQSVNPNIGGNFDMSV